MNKPDAEKIPDWKLERFLLGELPREEMLRIKLRVASDATLAQGLKALEDQYRDLLGAHPPGRMAEDIKSRLDKPAGIRLAWSLSLPRGRAFWVPALAVLLIAALPVLLFRGGPDGGPAGGNAWDDGRIKGSRPEIYLYRKTGQGTEQLRSGQKVQAGDLIQVFYDAAGMSQGMVFSVDAAGRLSRHFPEGGGRQSAALKKNGRTPLGFSFELDDSSWEKFYFIASDKPFNLDSLDRDGALPKGFFRSTFTLAKEPKS